MFPNFSAHLIAHLIALHACAFFAEFASRQRIWKRGACVLRTEPVGGVAAPVSPICPTLATTSPGVPAAPIGNFAQGTRTLALSEFGRDRVRRTRRWRRAWLKLSSSQIRLPVQGVTNPRRRARGSRVVEPIRDALRRCAERAHMIIRALTCLRTHRRLLSLEVSIYGQPRGAIL